MQTRARWNLNKWCCMFHVYLSSLDAHLLYTNYSNRSSQLIGTPASMHYVYVSLVQNAVCTCCSYVEKCEKGLCEVHSCDSYKTKNADDGKSKSKDTHATKCKAGMRERPANLFILMLPCRCRHPWLSRMSLFSPLTAPPRTWAWHGVAVWVSVSREWDRHGRLVGWSVDAQVPIDHTSVGLA